MKKRLNLIKHQGKDEGAKSLHLSELEKAHPTGKFVVVA